jgi:hypothetical protein
MENLHTHILLDAIMGGCVVRLLYLSFREAVARLDNAIQLRFQVQPDPLSLARIELQRGQILHTCI